MNDSILQTPASPAAPAPRVSVFITVYNRADLLPATVRSVLAQTMRDFELILVDDGSTDDSGQLCRDFAQQDERVRVITQPNGGIARAANTGVDACRAPLIARIDSDDLMNPTRLQAQADFMDAHPQVAGCGTSVELIDHLGRFLTVEHRPLDNATIQDHLLRGHCAITNPACMFRADALHRAGPYDQSFSPAEDFEMFLRLGEQGELANLPEALTKYRLHGGSASAQQGQVQRDHCRRACEQAAARRGIDQPGFEGGGLWRPGEDRASQLQYTLTYGWWAWQSREFATAASYGRRAVALQPWSKQAWMLLGKSLLRRGPGTHPPHETTPPATNTRPTPVARPAAEERAA